MDGNEPSSKKADDRATIRRRRSWRKPRRSRQQRRQLHNHKKKLKRRTSTSKQKVVEKGVKTAVALVAIVPLFFVLRGCFVAKGAYHATGSPELKFLGDVTQKDGVPAISGVVSFELKYQPSEGRRAFVEIVSDDQYNRKKDESYIGGWKEHQGSWGGAIVDASVRQNGALVNVPSEAVSGNGDRKFWVRTAVYSGKTFRENESSFDRIIYMLVGIPIDYKSGFYFLNEAGESHRYAASRYYPFWVLATPPKPTSQVSGTASIPVTPSPTTTGKATPSQQRVTAGVFTFEVPLEWEVATGALERQAKREVEVSVRQMLNAYGGTGSSQSLLGIQNFKAVRMPNQAGWFIAYTVRIPPQQDYLATMEKEQEQKLSWGKQQGMVTRVIEHGRQKIGDAEVVKLDSEMRQGARTMGVYYWSAAEPGLVGTITVVVNPGHYSGIKSALDGTFGSVRIATTSK